MTRLTGTYRRIMRRFGRSVTLRRRDQTGGAVPDIAVRARVSGFTAEEIAGGVKAGTRKILILAEDVPTSWGRLEASDAVVVDGVLLGFESRPDDQTHRDGEKLLAYECLSVGA